MFNLKTWWAKEKALEIKRKKNRLLIEIAGLEARIAIHREGGLYSALDAQQVAEAKKKLELLKGG